MYNANESEIASIEPTGNINSTPARSDFPVF